MEKFCCVKEISWDNPESAEAGLMAYTLLQVSMSMSCHVIQVRVSGGPSQCRVCLLTVPANQPVTSCRMRKALDHSVTDAPHLFQTATRMGSPSDLRAR